MSGRRLPQGGLIDRQRPLRFTFEGRSYDGFAGDTLASALLANGVRVVGRSFKYHRPRGILSAGVEEPNALMQVGEGAYSDPNRPATAVELFHGLVARAVNCWPNVDRDVGAILRPFERFIPAGFYYKTFMWPDWRLFEPLIRRAAGLGTVASDADPDTYETVYAHCDVLVVGAGPSGLAAAAAASASGARVILCEQDSRLGGQLNWDRCEIRGAPSDAWLSDVERDLRAADETRVLTRTSVIGYFDHNAMVLLERVADDLGPRPSSRLPRLRLWQVRAKRVVLATGAHERPMVFPGNDRPGVMLASAVRTYVSRFAVVPGDCAVVFTNNDDTYRTAATLVASGCPVRVVVDSRPSPPPELLADMRAIGVEVLNGAVVTGTRGQPSLDAVKIREASGAERWIEADLLAVSGGYNPAIQLFRQAGGQLVWDDQGVLFKPAGLVQSARSTGAAAGDRDLGSALASGHSAGAQTAIEAGFAVRDSRPPSSPNDRPWTVQPLWRVEATGKAFVDFQNDVSADDIALAAQENYQSVEHLKRYTTLGMAVDQGKTSNVNAIGLLSSLTGRSIPETGATLYRFPYTSVPMGALAGQDRQALFRPLRRLAAHRAHEDAGAVFEEYGGWLRPACFPKSGESAFAAEQREARCVREAVGIFDASPLGKIHVKGPDAAVFLDRVYANRFSNLRIGKARYGIMLDERGVVIDDGVTVRLAQDHFMVGTTGAGSARIADWLDEWLQCEWPGLQVILAPETTSWAVLTLSGPNARALLRQVGTSLDLSPDAFDHMSYREGDVAGMTARVSRVSFTGEVSFEISVPASDAPGLLARLLEVGRDLGAQPVGIDAWMLLRTEKGYLHIGADTDGATLPDDIGWGHVLRRSDDFIGRRSLTLPDSVRPDRFQFVGLEAVARQAGGACLPLGAHLRFAAARTGSDGYVTSSGFSPTLNRGVSLAMVKAGRSRVGEIVHVLTVRAPVAARITAPGACDPTGERLNG